MAKAKVSKAGGVVPTIAKAPLTKAAVGSANVAKVGGGSPRASIGKAPLVKAPLVKAPLVKAPLVKAPLAKAPLVKGPLVKAPLKIPVPLGKAPLVKGPLAAKAPLAKSPLAKAAVAKQGVAKAPVGKSSVAKAPVEKAKAPAPVAQKRVDTWRDFADTDPLYALIGEVGVTRVFDKAGNFNLDLMNNYCAQVFIEGKVTNPKDWVELWASMDIPVDNQTAALAPILTFALEHKPQDLGKIITELLLGHRIKTKTIEDSVKISFKDKLDKEGNLSELMFNIFPRGAVSPWGWGRTGWSWQGWWKLTSAVFGALKPVAAFDQLSGLLDQIEQRGGVPLSDQSQIWNSTRLATCRAALCKMGGIEEDELCACLDAAIFEV